MPWFPKELPNGPPEAWWQTTSLAELDESAAIIDRFTGESKQSPPIPRERFARAMALQLLCVDEGILDAVIDRADARSESYRPELRPDGDAQQRKAFASWLSHLEEIGFGLLRCAELLPQDLRRASAPEILDFLERIKEHSEAYIEYLFSKRPVPFKPRAKRIHGKR